MNRSWLGIDKKRIPVQPIAHEVDHNVRLFTFNTDMNMVGWVTEFDKEAGTISVIFPMVMFITFGGEEDETVEYYEFTPYLENLTEFNVDKPYNFIFPVVSLQSVTIPSEHVVVNYMTQLLMMKRIQDDENGVKDPETMH